MAEAQKSTQKSSDGYKLNCTKFISNNSDDATAALTPIEASMKDLKDGRWFTNGTHGQPGTISKVKMSKTGKHGHAKFTFNVSYPFTGQNSQEMHPGHTHLTKPEVVKNEYQVSNYENGEITAMKADGEEIIFSFAEEYDGSGGGPTGAQMLKLWEEVFDQEPAMDLWIQVLKAPVKCKKKPYWVCQVTAAQYKAANI